MFWPPVALFRRLLSLVQAQEKECNLVGLSSLETVLVLCYSQGLGRADLCYSRGLGRADYALV
eukprot:6214260-Pleurochrysis_carterae.AAC.2